MFKVFFAILCTVASFCYCSDSNDETPFYQLAVVVQFFNTTELCNHQCNASTWFNDAGSLHISFKTKTTADENPDSLCNCMYKYINQNDWLADTNHTCTVEEDTQTMVLIGSPNPKYNSSSAIEKPEKPLATLAVILKRFPNAELGGHNCTSTSFGNEGLVHLLLECKLTCKSGSYKKVCKNILTYLNQNHWLDDTKSHCNLGCISQRKRILDMLSFAPKASCGERCLTLEMMGE